MFCLLGTELLSACASFYDKSDPTAIVQKIAGVVCMDINVIRSVADLRTEANWTQLLDRVEDSATTCVNKWVGVSDVEAAIGLWRTSRAKSDRKNQASPQAI